jgi:hypothetical protein
VHYPLEDITVEVAFQTTVDFGTPFQLDNAIYGLLDTGTLGGFIWQDVTSMVQSVSVTRGRNRQTEQFNAGTASVVFYDPNRDLDPLNAGSPYHPFITPRQAIRIAVEGEYIYTGLIVDWNLDYGFTDDQTRIEAQCADGLTVLANMVLDAWTPSAQSSGDRVKAVLTRPEIEYQGGCDVGLTSSTLGDYAVTAGTNALQYLQTVATSEQGYLFMDRNGTLRFVGRNYFTEVAAGTFTDDGSGADPWEYSTLTNAFGDELLYNYVQLQSPAGTAQTAFDLDSIALYQTQQYSRLDLLNSTTAELEDIAQGLVNRYKDPRVRFTGVSLQLVGRNYATDVATLDIGSIVTVRKSFGVGTSPIDQLLVVTGVAHSITPGSYTVGFTFEPADQYGYFTLDSTEFGILDTNLLAF